jgi:hypothetical protein
VDQLAHTVQELSIAQRQRQGILTNLHKRVDKLAQQLSGLALESKRYGDKMGELDGAVIQQSAIRKLESYLYDCLSRVWHLDRRALDLAGYLAVKEGAIGRQERKELVASDSLAVGRDAATDELACVAVEISSVVKKDDVERAAERAAIFLKALRKALEVKPLEFSRLLDTLPTKSYAHGCGSQNYRRGLSRSS